MLRTDRQMDRMTEGQAQTNVASQLLRSWGHKNDFFNLSEGMQNCKMSGKIREKSGNFEVDDKWQP